jgi:hypothetical protein
MGMEGDVVRSILLISLSICALASTAMAQQPLRPLSGVLPAIATLALNSRQWVRRLRIGGSSLAGVVPRLSGYRWGLPK